MEYALIIYKNKYISGVKVESIENEFWIPYMNCAVKTNKQTGRLGR